MHTKHANLCTNFASTDVCFELLQNHFAANVAPRLQRGVETGGGRSTPVSVGCSALVEGTRPGYGITRPVALTELPVYYRERDLRKNPICETNEATRRSLNPAPASGRLRGDRLRFHVLWWIWGENLTSSNFICTLKMFIKKGKQVRIYLVSIWLNWRRVLT